MKCTGNAALAEFFNKHGAGNLLPPQNTDARGRYTSRVAGIYKEEIGKRVRGDSER